MGTPGIWWYDRGQTSPTKLTLPYLIRCERQPFRNVVDAEGWQMARHDRSGGQLVRIVSRLNTADHLADIRLLQTLDTHLRSGGRVAFAGDQAVVYAGRTRAPAKAGDTTLNVTASFLPFGTSTLSSGDELLIQTLQPLHYERNVLSADQAASGTGYSLALSVGLTRDVPEGSIIRQFRTFPVLYMDARTANSPDRWLADDRYPGRIFEMDLTLTELPYEVAALADAQLASGDLRVDMGGLTLESAVIQGLRERPRGLDIGAAISQSGTRRWT